jgi:RND family efflux transporter MFP subunit
MMRTEYLIAATLGVVIIIGGVGSWACTRDSAEMRAESPRADATTGANAVSVQVQRPERHDLSRQVVLPGSIEAFEQVTLYAKAAGYLKWIKVDIGDQVRQGQALAQIDVPEMVKEHEAAEADVGRATASLANAQAERERAQAEVELKKLTYERLRSIREQEPDVLPQQDVDEARAQFNVAQAMVRVAESKIKVAESDVGRAEAARARLATLMEYATIRTPFSGVVIKRFVDPGALIQHALSQTNVSPIVTVARVDTLRVFIDVAEPEVPFVKKGNRVTLTVDALPGKVFEAVCTRSTAALDPKTRTMRTEIDIPNRDGRLRPGMYGKVTLMLERRENALTVPAGALIVDGRKSFVFTVVDGRAKRVEVTTGLDDGIRVEITNGLTGTELIIVTGKSAVSDGTPVKVAEGIGQVRQHTTNDENGLPKWVNG